MVKRIGEKIRKSGKYAFFWTYLPITSTLCESTLLQYAFQIQYCGKYVELFEEPQKKSCWILAKITFEGSNKRSVSREYLLLVLL